MRSTNNSFAQNLIKSKKGKNYREKLDVQAKSDACADQKLLINFFCPNISCFRDGHQTQVCFQHNIREYSQNLIPSF